jgi:hypothetical protein
MDVVALKTNMPLPEIDKINSNISKTVAIIIDMKSKTIKPNKETGGRLLGKRLVAGALGHGLTVTKKETKTKV